MAVHRVAQECVRLDEPSQWFPFRKVAALISASPGLLGGVKSQLSLQIVLTKLGVHVIPDSFALGAAHQAFSAEGGLRDAKAEMRFAASVRP